MEIVLIVGIIAVVLFAGAILIYNGLVQRRLRIDEAFAQIEVQLKRRWDLIPNLVDAVKGYMGFEQQVLTDVTQARANAVAAGAQGPQAQAVAENALSSTLRSLFAVVENYPDLKSNQNVLDLQEQLTTTENQISFARQHYNASVLDYNSSIATFPNVLIAGPFGFTRRDFFDAEPQASQVPDVDLGLRRGRRRGSSSATAGAAPAPGPLVLRVHRPRRQATRRRPPRATLPTSTPGYAAASAAPPPRLRSSSAPGYGPPPPPQPPRQG